VGLLTPHRPPLQHDRQEGAEEVALADSKQFSETAGRQVAPPGLVANRLPRNAAPRPPGQQSRGPPAL